MYHKKILTIIKKGPAFNRQDAADWRELVDWKEVQEYREILRKTEYEAMMSKLLASARQEKLQDLKRIRALRETNRRIKQGASSLAEIYGKEVQNMSGKKFRKIIQERLQTAELYAGVVEKMETWKGEYCLLTDQERAIAQAYGYNIECSNCAAKEQCDTYIR